MANQTRSQANKKRWLALLLTLCIAWGMSPISAAAQESAQVFEVSDSEGFLETVEKINAAESGEFVIKLTENITVSEKVEFLKNTATILGQGHTLVPNATLSVKGEGTVLNFGSADGTDTLTISGENKSRTTAIISCNGATLNMYGNTTIKDTTNI